MAKSIKLGSDTYLDITGVAQGANSRLFYERGTWTPHLYDYETKIMNLNTANYIRIGNFVILYGVNSSFIPSANISTMLQIRNLPFSGDVIGGGVYLANFSGQCGDRTIQVTFNSVYFRPNISGLTGGTSYGVFSFWIIMNV